MNKYQEAKAWIDKINDHAEWARCDIEEPALSQLEELIEKATPKKVVDKTITDYYDDDGFCRTFEYKQTICPKCEEILIDEYEDIDLEGFDYCPNCGQKILWEDE